MQLGSSSIALAEDFDEIIPAAVSPGNGSPCRPQEWIPMDYSISSNNSRGFAGDIVLRLIASAVKLPVESIDGSLFLQEYGLDSMGAMELQYRIEEALGIRFPLSVLYEKTIDKMVAFLASQATSVILHAEREPSEIYQLSEGQKGIWAEYELSPGSSSYHVGGAVRIRGLATSNVLSAIRLVFENIPIVQARFERIDLDVVRRDCQEHELDILEFDATSWTELMIEARLDHEWNFPFDLRYQSPFRARVLVLGPSESILLLVGHHIACDFVSLELIQRDFQSACEALRCGLPVVIPPRKEVTNEYLDWWQRRSKSDVRLESNQSYWTRTFADIPKIEWPTAVESLGRSVGGQIHFQFETQLIEEVRALAKSERCSPFSVFYGAFALAVYSTTGQRDLAIGTAVAMRGHPALKNAIGYFANTILLRTQIPDSDTVSRFLCGIEKNLREALDHSVYPCWRLNKSRTGKPEGPQILFSMLGSSEHSQMINASALQLPNVSLDWGDWSTQTIELKRSKCQCDLVVSLAEVASGHAVTFEFSRDVLESWDIQALGNRFLSILRSFTERSWEKLTELDLLSAADRQILSKVNQTGRLFSENQLLHSLALRGMSLHPDGEGIRYCGDSLTFSQLDETSSAIAGALKSRGVSRGDRVVLYCDPGPDVVCSMLAILRLGGVFIPLATRSGNDWLTTILSDVSPTVVLADKQHVGRLAKDLQVLSLEEAKSANPFVGVDLDMQTSDPAYIMYTSGTTGKPKGVVVSHAAICNRLLWMKDEYPLDRRDCVLQKTPYIFDVSVWEFFLPLIAGIPQVVVPYPDYRDPHRIAEHIELERATIVHFVPSVLRLFLKDLKTKSCDSLRIVFSSGEPLDGKLRDTFFEKLPGIELHNLYGPTEAAVDATYWRCDSTQTDAWVPIGQPISNMAVYVLNENRKLVAPGVVGELYLGGIGLATEYWGQSDLTAQKFISCRLRGNELRLYHTGDRARIRKDGILEFCGRSDRQMKIGGERIELSAIEAIIRRHPAVADCIVTTELVNQTPKIEVFIVAATSNFSIAEVSALLQRSLPSSHRPHDWILVDSFPLTPSGKVDVSALKKNTKRSLPQDPVKWSNPKEAMLTALVGSLTGKAPQSSLSSFFELGGDSLRALQLRAALQEQGYDLAIEAIFESSTLQALATHIKQRSPKPQKLITPFSNFPNHVDRSYYESNFDDAYPLTRLQQALLYHSQNSNDYETYVLRVSIRGKWSLSSFRRGLAELAARHPMLRTSYILENNLHLQCVHHAVEIPLEVVDHRGWTMEKREDAIKTAVQKERYSKFDWNTAPLIRFRIDIGEGDNFDLTVCHPVLDGWSLMLLLVELLSTVVAIEAGRPIPFFPVPKSGMSDLVNNEEQALRSAETRGFWQRKLNDRLVAPISINHQVCRVRKIVQLPDEAVQSLRARSIKERVPLKSILLSIHLVVEGIRCNTSKPATGLIVNERSDSLHGERSVGLFLNTVLFVMPIAGTWQAVAQQAFQAEAELWPHRFYPFIELRNLAGGSPFESAFNFVNFHIVRELIDLQGIEIHHWENPSDFTFFPLAVYFVDNPLAGDLQLYLDFDSSRYSASTIESLAELYISTIINAGSALNEISDLKTAVPSRCLSVCEGALHDEGIPSVPVHEVIRMRALQWPDAIAISCEDRVIKYKDLIESALQVSGALIGMGISREEPIAILLDRDHRMVQAILGVMFAGGAFMMFDPRNDTLRSVETASRVGIKIGIGDQSAALNKKLSLSVIDPDVKSEPDERRTTIDSLAYIVATSGSTGAPKCVEVEHDALQNAMFSISRTIGMSQHDHWLSMTASTFDIAILEVLLPLLNGATISFVRSEQVQNPVELCHVLNTVPWTIMQGTPSSFRMAIDAGWVGSHCQRVLCGGEMLTRHLANEILDKCDEAWNCYGPCEATIWATLGRVVKGEAPPNVGTPIENTWVEIVGENGITVPRGTIGEVVIGGKALARGYRNLIESESNGFFASNKVRKYFTGDLGRLTDEGTIDIIGRSDRQLKIRGFRIELSEVEAAILRHSRVRATAVIAKQSDNQDCRLIAFIIADDYSNLQLREFLFGVLPSVMVPSEFRGLKELPLTRHGKVDYLKLSLLVDAAVEIERASHEKPRSELEQTLAEIWSEALGIANIGRDENFFSLGGHSLLALRVSLSIESRTGYTMSPAMIFSAPTISSLAKALSLDPETERNGALERAAHRKSRLKKRSPDGGN